MTDEQLEGALVEHYQSRHLRPVTRQAMIDEARKGQVLWLKPLLAVAAVAAVLAFAVLAAGPEAVEPPPSQPALAPAVDPDRPPRVYVLLTTPTGRASIHCGGDVMTFFEQMDLSLGWDELPRVCTVAIGEAETRLVITGPGDVDCRLEDEAVICVGP